MRSIARTALAATLICTLPLLARGQNTLSGADSSQARVAWVAPSSAAATVSSVRADRPLTLDAVDRKDPTLAGVLSFLIPGVGSFYAGNTTHGIVHLGIHVGSYALIVGEATSCAFDGSCTGSGGLVAAGYLVLLGNDVWSIFTAVNDAHAHNGDSGSTPGRVVGNLYATPAVTPLGVQLPGMTRSTGLQLFRWSF